MNPGQFFACCGLLELADRLWEGAEGWFDDTAFCLLARGGLGELVRVIAKADVAEITRLGNGLTVKPLIAPLALAFPENRAPLVLDAWVKVSVSKGKIVACGNPPWNFWSGQQTSLRIWITLQNALRAQIKDVNLGDGEALFTSLVSLSGRFGFDPGAAWSALDAGFSPNEQKIGAASSPALELLAAIGIQRFRPQISDDRETFIYGTWAHPLPTCAASAAASGLAALSPKARFRGRVVRRGSYAALGYSIPLKGNKK